MAYKFNPFTGTLDDVGAGGGGGTPGGSTTQVQFNDGGAFAGDADLVWNKTTNVLGITGDVNLSDGGTYTTTLQTITPTADRTISLPDATGTVALVAGSSGQLLWNNAGVNAGVPSSGVSATGNITLSLNGAVSTTGITGVPVAVTGTWVTSGGTATTTKPQVLIEPTGTSSGAWSPNGTGLGVNAASTFSGNLLDLQVNGTSQARISSSGVLTVPLGTISASSITGTGLVDGNGIWFSTGSSATNIGSLARFETGTLGPRFVSGIGLATTLSSASDVVILRDAADTLAQRRGTNAQTYRVYNTYTSSTNYELGKLEWSSNVFRIGTEKGSGGGTARAVEVHTDSIARLACDTTGSVRVVTALTVATLPGTPAVGMIARVTDATAPAVGVTVTGGGAAAALVWYNGTAWSVIGV